jgi:gamma-glutamyl hydrolase
MESYNYPIFGSQWHPEKNAFEWGQTNGIPNEAINHSPEAILIAQYTANFFVQQARYSNHKYKNPTDEQAALIENYVATPTTGDFMSTYFFHF